MKTLPEMLGEYADSGAARFHMPGHKGRGLNGFMNGDIARWDVTEIARTDNLHAPRGAILEGQNRMKKAYGAHQSFYAVNGSSGAIHAMILSLDQNEKLLLSRDCHKSAVGAVALSGIDTVFLSPHYNAELDLIELITPQELDRALGETGATAVMVTSPNYYGLCADLPGLSRVAHEHGALLLVDGAHGAHYPFSVQLPTPCGSYADLWCHSQHKTLNALTQAASVHVGQCRVNPETVRRMLAIIETTSPSFLLMASLDWATYTAGRQDWTGLIRLAQSLEKRIERLPGLSVLPDRPGKGVVEKDPTRLVIDVSGRGITGYQAQKHLEENNVYIEMADHWRLVLILSPEDDPRWYDMLYEALATLPYGRLERHAMVIPELEPERRMTIREASFARSRRVPLAKAAGLTLAEAVGLYPPGISLCVPGEALPEASVERLIHAKDWGAALFGVADGMVTVVDEE